MGRRHQQSLRGEGEVRQDREAEVRGGRNAKSKQRRRKGRRWSTGHPGTSGIADTGTMVQTPTGEGREKAGGADRASFCSLVSRRPWWSSRSDGAFVRLTERARRGPSRYEPDKRTQGENESVTTAYSETRAGPKPPPREFPGLVGWFPPPSLFLSSLSSLFLSREITERAHLMPSRARRIPPDTLFLPHIRYRGLSTFDAFTTTSEGQWRERLKFQREMWTARPAWRRMHFWLGSFHVSTSFAGSRARGATENQASSSSLR